MGCAVAFLGYAFVFEDGVFGAAGKFLFGLKLGEVNTFNEEVRDATEADFAVRPRSGRYVGASTEDDGGDQGVTTDLEFGAGGTITGSGRDSEDGRYTLSGRWGPPAEPQEVARCAWIERCSSRVDISRRAAATPRRRRGYSGETCRGAAAAATRIFREAGSRRRRGRDADIPARLVAAPPRPRRGYSAKPGRGDAEAATRIFRGDPRAPQVPEAISLRHGSERRLRRRRHGVRAEERQHRRPLLLEHWRLGQRRFKATPRDLTRRVLISTRPLRRCRRARPRLRASRRTAHKPRRWTTGPQASPFALALRRVPDDVRSLTTTPTTFALARRRIPDTSTLAHPPTAPPRARRLL